VFITVANNAFKDLLIKLSEQDKPIELITFITFLKMTCDVKKGAGWNYDIQTIHVKIQENIEFIIEIIDVKQEEKQKTTIEKLLTNSNTAEQHLKYVEIKLIR